jgi:hypothetical protein
MSDIIRTTRNSWLPMPGRSVDPRVHIPPDVYRFAQNQIESQQRQQQQQVNRTVRAGNIRSMPVAPTRQPPKVDVNVPSVIFNIPLTGR